jgi:hypothetical protein
MAKCRTSSSIVALCISIGVGLKRNQGNSRPLQPLLSDCGVIGGPGGDKGTRYLFPGVAAIRMLSFYLPGGKLQPALSANILSCCNRYHVDKFHPGRVGRAVLYQVCIGGFMFYMASTGSVALTSIGRRSADMLPRLMQQRLFGSSSAARDSHPNCRRLCWSTLEL